MHIDLPEFEKTLVSLAVELLRAPQEYPDLIVSPTDAQGEAPKDATRVTLHYLTALLAYGFPASYVTVRRAADWFTAPFPSEQRSRIDMVEMSRLEALLSVRPTHDSIPARLRQLVEQRSDDGHFDLGSENPYFDTLWALKVLNMARRHNLLDDLLSLEAMGETVDDLLQTKLPDKDLALALNLRCELFGALTDDQQRKYLQKLLNVWHRNSGMWGVSGDTVWIPESLRKQQLTIGELRAHRDPFRKMILNTGYVVENLAPLLELYPEVAPALRGSVELWWGVICENPAQMLHEVFPKPYDYVIMLARTLITLRALINAPLIDCAATHIYEELVTRQDQSSESQVRRSLRRVLEKLIAVDFFGEPEALRLGLSSANVVRVRPHVASLYDNSTLKLADSLVIKYGPRESIEAERASYKKLPDAIQPFFVRIPQDTFSDPDDQRSYVVMPDLHDYTTLFENVRTIAHIQKALSRELPAFLLYVHQGSDWNTAPAPRGIIQDLYLLPMQMHISAIFKHLRDSAVLTEEAEKTTVSELYVRLNDLCADLLRRHYALESFPRAYMHGDLHTRNIMLRQTVRQRPSDRELDFKLIDLEKFSVEGDAAMDLGELLVDLDMLLIDIRKRNDKDHPLAILSRALTDAYRDFARQRHDDSFEARVPLGQARFAIRVAKSKTRQIDSDLQRSKSAAREILQHCAAAADFLEKVLAGAGSGSNGMSRVALPEEER